MSLPRELETLPRELLKRKAYMTLLSHAINRTTLTTSELSRELGFAKHRESTALVVTILQEIGEIERVRSRPMLTSVIVKIVNKQPKPTQAWLRLYARIQGIGLDLIPQDAWQDELSKLYEYYSILGVDK